jgi:N6-adenosine-specific RNA methylase IME4
MGVEGLDIALESHQFANLFPLLEGADFDELVADVRAYGVREPIILYQGKILDGRNRYRAAQAAGVDCSMESYTGDDPLGLVISLNLKRRHLSESQRAMVAAKLATLKQGRPEKSGQLAGLPTQEEAAALLNVGERSVRRAAEVRDHGALELQHAVERGDISVAAAADIASAPLDEQREIVARGEREILKAAMEIRARKEAARRTERIARIAATANAGPLPRNRRWPVLLADPPWTYQFSPSSSRAVENHYETLTLQEICDLPVGEIATADAVLFLWVPPPILMQAGDVLTAWGFSYRTGSVWVKDKIGLGHYFRQQHEHLLLAVRGDLPTPPQHVRPPSVITAPRREHSRKPDEAYAIIEAMYPDLPKIEFFARHARPGWDSWGNEAPPPADSDMPDIPDFLRRAAL